jgi:hypothetical protein
VTTSAGYVPNVPSLDFKRALLRFWICFCSHMLYEQLLVVCTLCQAWNSIERYLEYEFVLVITCCMLKCWLCAHCAKPGHMSQLRLASLLHSMISQCVIVGYLMAHGAWRGLSCKPLAYWSWYFGINRFLGHFLMYLRWMFAEYWLIMQPYLASDLYVVTSIFISWCSLVGRVW